MELLAAVNKLIAPSNCVHVKVMQFMGLLTFLRATAINDHFVAWCCTTPADGTGTEYPTPDDPEYPVTS